MSMESFISNLPIETNKDMLDEEGNPRKDVEVHKDKLVCHPSMLQKLVEGLKLLQEKKIFYQEGEENKNE